MAEALRKKIYDRYQLFWIQIQVYYIKRNKNLEKIFRIVKFESIEEPLDISCSEHYYDRCLQCTVVRYKEDHLLVERLNVHVHNIRDFFFKLTKN